MREHAIWEAEWRRMTYELLDSWYVTTPQIKTYKKYHLALECIEMSSFFWGNDPDFDPANHIHREWLVLWCDEWLDKMNRHS